MTSQPLPFDLIFKLFLLKDVNWLIFYEKSTLGMYYILGKLPSFPGGKRLKTSLGQKMYYVCLGRDRIKLDRVPISVTMVVDFLDFLSQGYKIGFVKAKYVCIFFLSNNRSFA